MGLLTFPSQVNERAARLVAATVALTLAVAWVTSTWWLVPVVALGFGLRVLSGPTLSPLARLSVWAASRLFATRPVAGAPKRFAQGIGAACTTAASVLFFVGAAPAAWALVLMVVAFATLEASLSFCMGCWIYAKLQQVGVLASDACVECANIGPPSRRLTPDAPR